MQPCPGHMSGASRTCLCVAEAHVLSETRNAISTELSGLAHDRRNHTLQLLWQVKRMPRDLQTPGQT